MISGGQKIKLSWSCMQPIRGPLVFFFLQCFSLAEQLYPLSPAACAKTLPLPISLCSGAKCQALTLPGGTTPQQARAARAVTALCPLLPARNSSS